MINIKLTDQELSPSECEQLILDDQAGGHVVFIGTVRNHTSSKTVKYLDFEAYGPMAEKEMHKIAAAAKDRYDILHIVIHHRTGKLAIGEIPVIIAVSSAHRKAAFEACEFCIDTLKETVPIWKKEYFEDGEVWVAAHP
ncbi:molybdenum cofactor biosynthesis protein MoaE [Portibacter lacus]|uniref:Molybdopterin synthase catalytic subunit n=1 Tax=Portibacter lacus TaxID=1099794 RepID=A0AA37WEY4_9BACT|nr:molybdenum cofactor biosynthesis protein MoaE [Portibacter lacus]GLR17937.1 molybdopterin converting factor, subunit 2 [Portibacter lacus]